MKLKVTNWNTYRITGFKSGVVDDQASAGGIHQHQIRRRSKKTGWEHRIVQTNGTHEAKGPVTTLTDLDGIVAWVNLKRSNENDETINE